MKFGKKGKTISIDRAKLLSLKPKPSSNVKWEVYDTGEVAIIIERKYRGRLGEILATIFMQPKTRKIVLDEIGSYVWKMFNGKTSIREIITKISEKFKMSKREAEVSLIAFLSDLEKRGAITVAGTD
ncbi:MAG: hypothetical protein DRN81_01380 [Thermoproteota archaeon]|nr:MAG: hypothetical protein DRN81_01380 [Candidatus Korarchaeota archaeon]